MENERLATISESHSALNMAAGLMLDVWRLILFYLDEPHYIKLGSTGDRGLMKLLERRNSGFFIHHNLAKFSWPKQASEWSDLRLLVVSKVYGQARVLPSMDTFKLPPSLVFLEISTQLPNNIFALPTAPSNLDYLKELDAMLPCLRYLDCASGYEAGYWIFPSSVTHLLVSHGILDPSIPLPPNLIALDVNYAGGALPQLPSTLESLSVAFSPGPSHIKRTDLYQLIAPLAHLNELKLIENSSERLSLSQLLLIPHSVTILSLASRKLVEGLALAEWLPPRLISLHLDAIISPSQYHSLPRSLTYLSNAFRGRPYAITTEAQWKVTGRQQGGHQHVRDDIGAEVTHQSSEIRYFEDRLRDIPPSFKRLRLAPCVHLPAPTWIEQLSTYFTPGLTSLDMRNTSFIADSQFAHLPVTLTQLYFQGVTLPKTKLLSRLRQLNTLGLHGGTLTTSIALALPNSITSITLFHVALITKGVHYPSADPNEPVKFSQWSPQLLSISSLPPRLKSLTILPSPSQLYWSECLVSIITVLPAYQLETLIIDIKMKTKFSLPERWENFSSLLASTTDNSTYAPLLRFTRLKHLFLDCSTRGPALQLIRHSLLPALPTSLTALHLPFRAVDDSNSAHLENTLAPSLRYSTLGLLNGRAYSEFPQCHNSLLSNRMMQDSGSDRFSNENPDPSRYAYSRSYRSFL